MEMATKKKIIDKNRVLPRKDTVTLIVKPPKETVQKLDELCKKYGVNSRSAMILILATVAIENINKLKIG